MKGSKFKTAFLKLICVFASSLCAMFSTKLASLNITKSETNSENDSIKESDSQNFDSEINHVNIGFIPSHLEIDYLYTNVTYYIDIVLTKKISNAQYLKVTTTALDNCTIFSKYPNLKDSNRFIYYFKLNSNIKDNITIICSYKDQTVKFKYRVIENDLNYDLFFCSRNYSNNWDADNSIFTNYDDLKEYARESSFELPKIKNEIFNTHNIFLFVVHDIKKNQEDYARGLYLYDDTLIGQFYFEFNSKYWDFDPNFEPQYTSSYFYTIPKEINIKTILTKRIFVYYD